jgi:integrase
LYWQQTRPRLDRGETPVEEEQPYTVKQLCTDFIEGYARKLKRSWNEDERQLWKDIIPLWGHRPAKNITRADAYDLLTEVADRGDRVAQLLLAVSRKAWNHAMPRHPELIINPFARLKVVGGVVMDADTRVPVIEREARYLDDAELGAFLRTLPGAPMMRVIKDILRLQLLTASRKGEVCTMEWAEVNLEKGVWVQPPEKTKNRRRHRVMLSRQAMDLLRAQPVTPRYVFASGSACGHVRGDSVNEALSRCMKHFDLDHFTPHALRHSVVTGLSFLRCPEIILSRLANHRTGSITARYNHNPMDQEALDWLQRWADHLDNIAGSMEARNGG